MASPAMREEDIKASFITKTVASDHYIPFLSDFFKAFAQDNYYAIFFNALDVDGKARIAGDSIIDG